MRHRRIVPYNIQLRPRAQSLRRDPTPAERKLWYLFLSSLPCKFTRQKPLGSYVVDFYCSAERLVIEVDGDSHFDEKGEVRDAARTTALEAEGLRVMRFRNDEVRDSFEGVCQKILAALKT
jgi:very-short-patch-repair endonuclease